MASDIKKHDQKRPQRYRERMVQHPGTKHGSLSNIEIEQIYDHRSICHARRCAVYGP